jgi:3-phenylpropionate/trans-cinnamate dioxygenase ferredoxin reductase subunit
MTNAVARLAREAGAACYTDPFVPHEREANRAGLMGRIFGTRDEEDLERVA